MSMTGNYLRVAPEVLAGLKADPDSILNFLYPDDEARHPEGRHLDIGRSWQAIHFLLNGDPWEGDPPLIDAVLGGTPIGTDDFGYGPTRYLNPEDVQAVAVAIDALPAYQLLEEFDPGAMNDAQIYAHGWRGSEEERQCLTTNYIELVAFFNRAAKAGDAMLLYLT